MGPYEILVRSVLGAPMLYMVCNRYIRIPDSGSILGARGMDCREEGRSGDLGWSPGVPSVIQPRIRCNMR